MPQAFTDSQGNRVIVRHKGPAGVGIPIGGTTGQILVKGSGADYVTEWANAPNGTGAAVGPASATNNNIVLFNGTTGKLLKDSAVALSDLAPVSALAAKQNAESGKGLSQENFTTGEKAKLSNLSSATFRGVFASLTAINAFSFNPVPQSGDWCVVEALGVPSLAYNWDHINGVWRPQIQEAVDMTGQEIANALFNAADSVTWDSNDCRIFTQTEKSQLEAHEAIVNSSGLGVAIRSYGSISYFSTVGVAPAIATISDGLTNMVKIDVPTALGEVAASFDNGGASNGRLRYTGALTKNFAVTVRISTSVSAAETLVFGLAKNATIQQPSRVLVTPVTAGTLLTTVTLTAHVSLAVNDFLEVFVGNITGTTDPTIYVLAIEALSF